MNKIILATVLLFSLYSCKKETIIDQIESDKMMSQDNHLAESSADDASIMSDEAYYNNQLTSRGGSGILGDTVKIIKSKTDSTITIDFGINGIVGKDQKIRKGKIIIKFSGGYKVVGSTITQTFDNYYTNGNKVEGSRSITFKGDSATFPQWKIVSNLTITKANGKVITWNSERTRTQIAGMNNLGWGNNEYLITGYANGTSSLGDIFSITITKALYVKLSCKYIQDGKITYNRNSRTCTLDYGYSPNSASCDDKAKLNYNGTDYIIDL